MTAATYNVLNDLHINLELQLINSLSFLYINERVKLLTTNLY